MSDFDFAIEATFKAESGVANHPDDRGGLTNRFGITWRLAERYGFNDPRDIDLVDAKRIMKLEFWDPLRLSDVSSKFIAAEVFDTAVNSGPTTAAKILQRAINLIALQAKTSSVSVDGRIGPKTILAVNEIIRSGYEKHLYHAANGFQFLNFLEIVERNSSQSSFIAGWMMRLSRFEEMLP